MKLYKNIWEPKGFFQDLKKRRDDAVRDYEEATRRYEANLAALDLEIQEFKTWTEENREA